MCSPSAKTLFHWLILPYRQRLTHLLSTGMLLLSGARCSWTTCCSSNIPHTTVCFHPLRLKISSKTQERTVRESVTYFHSVASVESRFLHGTSCVVSSTRELAWTGNNFTPDYTLTLQRYAAAPLRIHTDINKTTGGANGRKMPKMWHRSVEKFHESSSCHLWQTIPMVCTSLAWLLSKVLCYLAPASLWSEMIDGTGDGDLAPCTTCWSKGGSWCVHCHWGKW